MRTKKQKITRKKYQHSEKGKIADLKALRKYRKTEKGRLSALKGSIKFYKTKKEKIVDKRAKAKRKRNMGWILMFENPFADSVLVEYHHITDAYVVAIPRNLHRLYLGKYHRENTMEIVKQIYLGD